jgi:hypothetical protein
VACRSSHVTICTGRPSIVILRFRGVFARFAGRASAHEPVEKRRRLDSVQEIVSADPRGKLARERIDETLANVHRTAGSEEWRDDDRRWHGAHLDVASDTFAAFTTTLHGETAAEALGQHPRRA